MAGWTARAIPVSTPGPQGHAGRGKRVEGAGEASALGEVAGMAGIRRVRVLIQGRVQGVFFRESTRRRAAALGLCGWVRNLPSDRVEALFQGPGEQVEEMLAWCRLGPPAAKVTDITVCDETPEEGENRFVTRATVRE